MTNSQRLSTKAGIVTGGSSGIGAAAAVHLASLGAAVVVMDIQAPGEGLAALLADMPDRVSFQCGDVTDQAAWDEAVSACRDRHHRVDFLVNNAGMLGSGRPVHTETVEGMQAVFDVNVLGIFLGMRAVLPVMVSSGRGGSIVNVSSVWGLSAVPSNVAYQTAKAAAIMLSKNAGVTYAPEGVRVNVVLPGYIDTPMSRGVTEAEAERLLASTPIGRRGVPSDIAGMIAHLVSDEASFTTAGVFAVDGGMSAL